MLKWFLTGLIVLSISTTAFADTAPSGQRLKDRIVADLTVLQSKVANNASTGAVEDTTALTDDLQSIAADPAFAALASYEQHSVYFFLAEAYQISDKPAEALRSAKLACQFADAGEIDWTIRTFAASQSHDRDEAVDSFTYLIGHWPAGIDSVNEDWILQTFTELRAQPDQQARTTALAETLFAMPWKPKDPFLSADFVWLTLTLARLGKGDLAGAKASAALVDDISDLIQMNADKRFDAVVAADRAHYDASKALAREIDEAKMKASAAPDKLQGINGLAELMLQTGKTQVGLQLVDDALGRAKNSAATFSDFSDQLNWTLDIRSRALFASGRSDEALQALADGANTLEHGGVNVSQAINLADSYNIWNRPRDALVAVASLGFDNASPYGRMALEDARACAYYALGDTKSLADTMAYMKSHIDDGVQNYVNTLLFTNDSDALAAELIRELDDPSQRGNALSYLQDYLPVANLSPREATMHAELMAVRGRKDVRAEIAKVGRISSYPVTPPWH